jgi:hypothetical protein
MATVDELVRAVRAGCADEVEQLADEKGIKQQVLNETQQYAQREAMHIMHPDRCDEPPSFDGINLSDPGDMDDFLLILDYLESMGLKFTPQVLKFESQHPQTVVNRKDLCRRLHLRSYDRTPLLVQLLEERYAAVQGRG